MAPRKSWTEKWHTPAAPQVKPLDKAFADMPAGKRMLIATPRIIEDYIRQSSPGRRIDIKTLRRDLAAEYGADYTCPVTTGIFLRIVSEAAWEQLQQGTPLASIAPFWRAVAPGSPLSKKLACGEAFLAERWAMEGM